MPTSIDNKIEFWQTENHELGMIQFSPTDSAVELFPYYDLPADSTFLGLFEADALCLMHDGSVVVFDHEAKGRVLCPAASNQKAFLSALGELQEHFAKCVVDDVVDDVYCNDLSAAAGVRDRCTLAAGGDDYLPFYSMMLGV